MPMDWIAVAAPYLAAMKVVCPTCRSEVPAADINIQAMTAMCRACNEVFAVTPDREASAPAGLPARFTRSDEGSGRFGVSWRWWRLQHVFLLFFCGAWDAFLVFWYSTILTGHAKSVNGADVMMIVFPICHVAVGIGLTYYLIASMFNRTWIKSDGDTLTVRHGPVPWAGNRSVPIHALRDLRVEAKYQRNSAPRFSVIGVNNGQDVALVKDLDSDEANWIRQQLASLLTR
jgi:hypothetical protein